jgi:hypothetical protein
MATVNLGRIKPVFRGAYNNSTAYVIDDIVTSGNETFIAIAATTGNATSDASKWTKLAAKGADGTDVAATLANKEIAFKTNAGALDGIPIGTAGQILKVNSGATGYEFGAEGGGAYVKVRGASFTSEVTTSSQSYQATPFTDSITPASTSNKIIINGHLGGCEATSGSGSMHLKLYRQISGGGFSSIATLEAGYLGYHVPNGFAKSFAVIDTPNTTNQVDYKVYLKNEAGGGTVRIGGSSATSTIILQEIDGGKFA